MIKPQRPSNEEDRMAALRRLEILDSEAEKEFDDLVELASQICDTPISLISLIDDNRQWFKSKRGIKDQETPRDLSFCAHAINSPREPFIIEDAHNDERFHDNPYVIGEPYISFYAGLPITTSDGMPLGTLCVIDEKPKKLSKEQLGALSVLSEQVMKLLELRLKNKELHRLNATLELKNEEVEQFAKVAAHDLKSPLFTITQIIDLINQHNEQLPPHIAELIGMIDQSSRSLAKLVGELLELAKVTDLVYAPKTLFSVKELLEDLKSSVIIHQNIQLGFSTDLTTLHTNKAVCSRVLYNLVTNAIKYNDKDCTEIGVSIRESDGKYVFHVDDNGPGIPLEKRSKLFKPFCVLAVKDRFGNRGTGIGLASIKSLLDRLHCNIELEEKASEGCSFRFELPKGK